MTDSSEKLPLDTTWLYRASIDEGAPEWLLVAAGREIDRLRDHVRSVHRLNGHSKQKGWWCSCGENIQPAWISYRLDRGALACYPWSPEGRKIAQGLFDQHVALVVFGGPS
jgi:hypothetical protein